MISSSEGGPALVVALDMLGRAFEHIGARHVVVGGIAVIAWSHPRSTIDIDCLVATQFLAPEELRASLLADGFSSGGEIHRDVMMAGFRLLSSGDPARAIPVDVLVSDNPVVAEIVSRATTKSFAGICIKVPALEDLIVLKLQAQRRQDIADCEALIAVCRDQLDWQLLARQAAAFDVSTLLASLLSP